MTEQANFKRLLQSATGDDDASPQMLDVLYLSHTYTYIKNNSCQKSMMMHTLQGAAISDSKSTGKRNEESELWVLVHSSTFQAS
jgi:hypothetical protein